MKLYRVRQASQELGVPAHWLRYNEYLLRGPIQRSRSGQRLYTQAQLAEFRAIKEKRSELGLKPRPKPVPEGTLVSFRASDRELDMLDKLRADKPRAYTLRRLIRAAFAALTVAACGGAVEDPPDPHHCEVPFARQDRTILCVFECADCDGHRVTCDDALPTATDHCLFQWTHSEAP